MLHPESPRPSPAAARAHVAGIAAAAAACVLFASASATAAPKWIRLSIVHDASQTMTVAWHTTAAAGTKVQYGTDAANLTQPATGTSALGPGAFGTIHEAEMTGLSPGTKYYYRVGDDADGWSSVLSFVTAPPPHQDCGKLRFVFLGDNRPDSILGMGDNWTSILAEAAKDNPLFVLNGGDLVYDGKENGEWVDFLNWTGGPTQYVPFMPSMGNHDDDSTSGDGAQYNKLFALPRSTGPGSSGTEDYYFFTAGHAIFVALNTQNFKDGTPAFQKQATWLDDVLTNNVRRWKFVFFHHPIYTSGGFLGLTHPPDEQGQNEALVKVIDKHHVDFVFQSHNHWYERFQPSNCTAKSKPGSDTPCPVGPTGFDSGTVYLTSGGAGALTIPLCGSTAGLAACKTQHHYVVFDIDNESLQMKTWATSQQTLAEDPKNHVVIDEIKFAKTPVSCAVTPDGGAPDGAVPDGAVPDGAAGDASTDAGAGGSAPDAKADGPKADSAGGTGGSGAAGEAGEDSPLTPSDDGAAGAAQPAAPGVAAESGDSGGCGCRQVGTSARSSAAWGLLAGFVLGGALTLLRLLRRRRRFAREAAASSTGR
jgi:hypothetical protein